MTTSNFNDQFSMSEDEELEVIRLDDQTSGSSILPEHTVESSENEEQMEDDEEGEEEDVVEVDLADEEEAGEEPEDTEAALDENADPNTGAAPDEARAPKSRAPTCPLDLPMSVVRRIMKSAAPNKRFTPDMISALSRSAGTFGLYLLSACQEAAQETGRNTIRPLEVVNGLIACGFPELAEEVRVTLSISTAGKRSKKTRRKN